ncbi:ferricrocin synthase [Microdochium nivale]|nr:ferricrocin synthase [Microdochium nivale]
MAQSLPHDGLSILNPYPSTIDGPCLLHDLVRHDDKLAVEYFQRSESSIALTYIDLHAAADALSQQILESLVSCDDSGTHSPASLVVPLLIPQSPALYIAQLAILKAGGAFCPLNLDAPQERIKFILNDVGARIVLCSPELAARLPSEKNDRRIILVESDAPITTSSSEARKSLASDQSPDSLAYVMYTSGSTGTPKGVGISHRAATQALLAHDRHIPSFRRFLQFAAPTFDVSVFEIFFPFMRGSTLVCSDRGELLADLPGFITRTNVDACELTPSVAGSLLKSRNHAPGLKLLLTIGEMLTDPVVKEFGGDDSGDSVLWGMYGPTEATIHCTLQPAFLRKQPRRNIGFPLDNVSAFVIDADPSKAFEPLPLGQAGELAVGGNQLAVGYIERPEQTAAAFIDSPWGRVYRTGDKAIITTEGTIECLGRINDTQVKLNGQRMELGEVEQVVLGTPGCHSAVAAVISNTLVAFAAVDDLENVMTSIIERCKSWLPAFMTPTDLRLMSEFPRLPSGKVDRKKLVADYQTETDASHERSFQFEDELEKTLCQVAKSLTQREVQPPSRVSSLGIDSLVAIGFAAELRHSGIDVSPLDILESTTLHDVYTATKRRLQRQSASVDHDRQNDKTQDASRLLPATTYGLDSSRLAAAEIVSRCTALQQSMIAETLQDARMYVNELKLGFPAGITPEVIRGWFLQICNENQILRSGFVQGDHGLCHITWASVQERQIIVVENFTQTDVKDVEEFLARPLEVQIMGAMEPDYSGAMAKITIHHAIYDGWTADLLIERLNGLHREFDVPATAKFQDVVRASEELGAQTITSSQEYWAEELRSSTICGIPNFRTKPVYQPQIHVVRSIITASPQQVRDISSLFSLSDQVVFQAALAWLWSTITGVDDILLGSVSSGRTIPVDGIEKAMGPFMTTLPLRVQFGQFQTVAELLQVIQASNRRSLRHGSLSLSDIKKAGGIPSRSRIFDVIFAYQESLLSRKAPIGGIREISHKDAVEAKLLVEIQPADGHFVCQMTWHTDTFSQDLIASFSEQLGSLVNHFLHFSASSLSQVRTCFSPAALSTFNLQPASLDITPSLAKLVEETTATYPNNAALQFVESFDNYGMRTRVLTYKGLNTKANQVAGLLIEHGVKPGDVVAIVMEKSPLLYSSILGILKAGGAYLPMLPSTPALRKQRIVEQARPRLCLTSTDLQAQLSQEGLSSVIAVEEQALSQYGTLNQDVSADSESLAYVIYTSGTTGVPKGVAVTNRNMLSNIKALSSLYPHKPSSRMLQACSQAFDVSVFEIFFAWANGMCLCSATNDTLFENLGHAITLMQVTHLSMTVTVASLLQPRDVPSVEFLVTSGEAMTDEVLAKWHNQLWQGYGPSETTNICTVRKVEKGDSSQFLGWAFENTSTFVCYPGTSDLVPIGCVGEFCFGGDQVAAGYLQMPDLTAEKFFDHPKFGRLYRSGDRGRMLPDGSLIILGRIDTQIKLRGLRIELQEIQKVVLQTQLVRACEIVVFVQQGRNTEQLALMYVPIKRDASEFITLNLEEDKIANARVTIQQELQAALPDYMVPSFSVPISTLPRTSSGKIDRARLRTAIESLPVDELESYSASLDQHTTTSEWTEAERLVANAAAETANVDLKTITQWSSLAALGVDSIMAMTLSRKLQNAFQQRVPLSLILKNPSIGRLAATLSFASREAQPQITSKDLLPREVTETLRSRISIEWGEVESILPCTPLQESMLFATTGSSFGASYCNMMLFRLHIPFDDAVSYWKQAFQRHGILRTCFASTEVLSHPVVQVVIKSTAMYYKHFDDVSPEAIQATAQEIERLLPAAIDSGKPPVVLATVNTTQNSQYLCFACHHALYDGISIKNLLLEIETLAQGGSLEPPVPFDRFLQQALEPVDGTEDFWKPQFADFVPQLLQTEVSTPEVSSTTIFQDFTFQPLDLVESRLKELGVSLLSCCQASWALTMSLIQNSNDVCFGNVMSGRSFPVDDIDKIVAPCFNTIPMRVNLSKSKFRLDLAKRMHGLNVDNLPFQFTALRRIQKLVSSSARLFDTILILQPGHMRLDDRVWSLEQDNGAMEVPIVCEITPDRDRNVLRVGSYRQSDTVSQVTLQLTHDIFQFVLARSLEHPHSQLITRSDLPKEWQESVSLIKVAAPVQDTEAKVDKDNSEWSKTEQLVRSAVSSLTNVPENRIQRDKPLFHYGVDSIGIVQVIGILERSSLHVSVADIMESPTCAKIAAQARIMDVKRSEDPAANAKFDAFREEVRTQMESQAEWEDVLPCTALQQAMLSQSMESDERLYFNYVSWDLDPGLDAQKIVDAWIKLQRAHQILRAGFVHVDSSTASYAMVVHHSEDLEKQDDKQIRLHSDLSIEDWRKNAARTCFSDISQPPWRVAVVERGDGLLKMHLAIHHALYDAHSLQLLLRSLASVLLTAKDLPIRKIRPALAILTSTTEDNSSFWREKAAGIVVNKFPTMTPLVEPRGVSAESSTSKLSLQDAKGRAAAIGVSLQAAVQVAWTQLLSSYLGETTVTFGVVFSGRSTQSELDAEFPVIATQPVIGHAEGTVADQLQRMLQYNASLLRFTRTPLPSIQTWLGRPGESLFDTLLVYQVSNTAEYDQPWKVCDELASVGYAVSLEIQELTDVLGLNIVFDTSVLPAEQAQILLAQFDTLLIESLQIPGDDSSLEIPPSKYSTTFDQAILSILPAPEPIMPCSDGLLHEMIESSVSRNPNAVALEFVEDLHGSEGRRQWTYEKLNEAGNQVANFLLSKSVPPRSIVAVCFNKTPEAYFSILGILKAGCCFLALDPTAPATRQEFILQDSGAACLLVEDGLFSQLAFESPALVHQISMELIERSPTSPPQLSGPIATSDPCYCLYTSGTTGTPKGCLISHENTVQAMLAFTALFRGHWTDRSRWLQFASFHFDVSVLEQYWSWHVGITVVSAPRDLILSNLIETISKLKITHIDLTPSLARLVHPDDVPSLCEGVFITGGEQLRQDVLEAWGPHQVIYNAYGPTEATIGVTMFQRVPANGRPSNIGKQFPNVGAYVLEPNTEIPVLRGAVGELCVSGKLVGIGYLNRPELTIERFAYLESFKERVYRTGDLVRVLHDGSIDFLGRADDQVKLRGQRLEIGEINHAIKSSLSYSADVATLVTKQQDRDLLVSFITASVERDPHAELQVCTDAHAFEMSMLARNTCKGRLSGYMVPSYVLCVPWIPLSANNKADIKRLKALFQSLSLEDLRHITSGTESAQRGLYASEAKVAKIVSSITGIDVEDITHSSTILELGIDSISVTRLARALQSVGFDRASPSALLKNGQIDCISDLVSKTEQISLSKSSVEVKQLCQACFQQNLGIACAALNVSKDDIEYIAPCTPLQEGMVARAQSSSNTPRPYFNQFELQLKPGFSTRQLKKAWTRLYETSSILRTAFLQTSDGCIQISLKNQELPWTELSAEPDSVVGLLATRHLAWVDANTRSVCRPFELDLLNIEGESKLVVRIFHALYDAHSLKLMLERVANAIDGTPTKEGATFHNALQAGLLETYQSSQPFWRDVFQGWQTTHLSSAPQEGMSSTESQSRSRMILIDGFENKRKALGVTHQTMVQAAWLVVLQEYLLSQPCFGVIYSGRSIDIDSAENVIGPLFNTLPFTTPLYDTTTWDELALQVQNFNTSVLEFVHTPLRSIQKWCNNGRPLFDSLFTFDREDIVDTKGDEFWEVIASSAAADYDLALEAFLTRDGLLSVTIVAQSTVADASRIENLLDALELNIHNMINSERGASVVSPESTKNISLQSSSRGSRTPGEPSTRSVSPSASSVSTWPEDGNELRREIARLAGVTVEEIQPGMTIFDFGLDSIDAIRLASKAASLGYRISPGELLRGAAIDSILVASPASAVVADLVAPETTALDTTIATLERILRDTGCDMSKVEAVIPTTPLQDSMVAEMISSDFQRYFNQEVFRLSPGVNLDRLKSAWEQVVSTSPILRTTFVEVSSPEVSSAYAQVIGRASIQFDEIVLTTTNDFNDIMDRVRVEAEKGGATTKLFSLTICHLDDEMYLLVSLAHALYDGHSLGMIYHDVQLIYNGHHVDRPDYKPYLGRLVSTTTEAATNFWSSFLHNVQPSHIPTMKQAGTEDATVHRLEKPSYCRTTALKETCRKLGVTPQVLAQAAWAVVLSGQTQQLESTFGLVLSGRDTDMAQQINFPTMNTVAMRVVLHGTVKEFLRHLQTTMSHVMEFQHTPLRQIRRFAKSQGQPLFNSLFVFQTAREAQPESRALMEPIQGLSAVEYPVCVEFELTEPYPTWRVACDSNYGDQSWARNISDALDKAIQFFCDGQGNNSLLRTRSGTDTVSICGLEPFTPRGTNGNQSDKSPKRSDTSTQVHKINGDVLDIIREISGSQDSMLHPEDHITSFLDSISAIKACALLRKRGIFVSVREMLSAGTIAGLSNLVSRSRDSDKSDEPGLQILAEADFEAVLKDLDYAALLEQTSISPDLVEDVLPAIPMQVYMLNVWQNTRGALFWPTFGYKLTGNVSSAQIITAWKALVADIPLLRTEFLSTGSDVVPLLQLVLKSGKDNDVEAPAPHGQWKWDTCSSRYVQLSVAESVDGNSFDVSLHIHHVLYDAFSISMIMRRFETLCNPERQTEVPSDRTTWATFTKSHLSPVLLEKRKTFWTSYLKGVGSHHDSNQAHETLDMGDGSKSEAVSEYRQAVMPVSGSLASAVANNGVTMQHMFFAAYAKVLAAARGLAEDHDLVIGVYLSNRSNFASLEELACPTLALVPLRIRRPLTRPVGMLAAEIRTDIDSIGTAENTSAGLWEIHRWTSVTVDTFVNFLPAANLGDKNASSALRVTLETSPLQSENGELSDQASSLKLAQTDMPAFANNHVKNIYPDSLDIEAAVRDGSLDVGVFCRPGKLSRERAVNLINELVKILHEVGKQ